MRVGGAGAERMGLGGGGVRGWGSSRRGEEKVLVKLNLRHRTEMH